MRCLILIAALLNPLAGFAQEHDATLEAVAQTHILPGFQRLADEAGALNATAQADCTPGSAELRAAYNSAFDAWLGVSHLRFGPSEEQDRAFALAFWPDTKGFTPKALGGMIAAEDPALYDANEFATTSVAGRGFYALEAMLYDDAFDDRGDAEYRCDLIRAIARDIDRNADAINTDWQGGFADQLTEPAADGPYRDDSEAVQEVFKALTAGLQFTADTRLGRPMGTFDRPRPKRAEARRSERSLRHVDLSLIALRDLAALLSADHLDIAVDLDAAFVRSLEHVASLDDPVFAGVATPQGRLRVEALQQSINDIRQIASTGLGPTLGVAAGFNSLDGD